MTNIVIVLKHEVLYAISIALLTFDIDILETKVKVVHISTVNFSKIVTGKPKRYRYHQIGSNIYSFALHIYNKPRIMPTANVKLGHAHFDCAYHKNGDRKEK